MNEGKFILVNGAFLPSEEYRISLQEFQAFLFAEKLRAVRTNFPFFHETLEIIRLKLRIFNCSFPDLTDREGTVLKRQLERTLTKNKLFQGAIFTITFRSLNSKMYYSINSEKFDETDFEMDLIA